MRPLVGCMRGSRELGFPSSEVTLTRSQHHDSEAGHDWTQLAQPPFLTLPMATILQCMTPFPTTLPGNGLPGDFDTGEGNPGSLDSSSGAAAISVTGVVVAAAVAAGAAAVGLP